MPSALSVARPAVAAVALFAAVAVTGYVLSLYWPAGVAVGLALGIVAVLTIGARMQLSDRANPADTELESRLGIGYDLFRAEPAAVAATEAEPEAAPARPESAPDRPAAHVVELEPEPAAPALHAQGDVLYFTSDEDPDVAEPREVLGEDVRTDLETLKAELGDDYRDFARAARLVVETQYASAARLQRDLALPYSRARRLLTDLEQQHFVGPATGSLPRQVLMPKERLPEVERLLADA